jgi:hypothetical protein
VVILHLLAEAEHSMDPVTHERVTWAVIKINGFTLGRAPCPLHSKHGDTALEEAAAEWLTERLGTPPSPKKERESGT